MARHEAAVRAVLDAGAADVGTTDLAAGVAGASLVVLCAPVGALPGLIRAAWPHLAPGAVLTDAGSVKRSVVDAARGCPARAGVSFVGGHPMAGSERSGFEASAADLFDGRVALVTPTADTPEPAVLAVTALWEGLGSTVRRLSPEAHDHLVAQISHLPHLAAYALVAAADGDALPLAGRGFVDTTRIAASAEALWTDIFRENRGPLLDALARYEAVLGRWRELAARGDWATLEAELRTRARGPGEARVNAIVRPVRRIAGTIAVPGDKSVSHRAALLGALADGLTEVQGFLEGEDCLATLRAVAALGAEVARKGPGHFVIQGVGMEGLTEPGDVVDCGNSGTMARLLVGVLAGQPFATVLTGDESLRRRPMDRVMEPLTRMGARVLGRRGGARLPLAIAGARPLHPIRHVSPVASAQVKSAVLLAGLSASGPVSVVEPARSRDHTERMLAAFGGDVRVDGETVTVVPGRRLVGASLSRAGRHLVGRVLPGRGRAPAGRAR